MTCHSEQDGSKVGYNTKKPARESDHPLIAFMSETRMVINAWLRPGNTVTLSNIEGFLEQTLEILSNVKIRLVRTDSGFYAYKFLNIFERRDINYIVSVKLYKSIKHLLDGLSGWINLKDEIQMKELKYRTAGCKEERGFKIVRKEIEKYPKSAGKLLLFDESQLTSIYRYSVFVTNLAYQPNNYGICIKTGG